MKQITEDYVSFETTKLLKEKGFRAVTNRYYNAQYDQIRTVSDSFMMDWNDEEYMKSITMPGAIAIPTHQMALKWLREVHHLQICVSSYSNRWEEYVHGWQFLIKKLTFTEGIGWNWDDSLDAITDKKMSDDITYITYEQAVEAAIKYTLENLI